MNFLNLRYFLAVVEEENITRAAERLYISQQSLSNHIRKLEQELETPLFNRLPSLQLTYAGSVLADAASRILAIETELHAHLRDIQKTRRELLRVGCSLIRGKVMMPLLLPAYKEKNPHVDLFIQEGRSSEMEECVAKGMLDIMMGFLPILTDTVRYEPLHKERLFLIVPRSFMADIYGEKADEMRKRYRSGVNVKVFGDYPFILLKHGNRVRTLLDACFAHSGIKPRVFLELDNLETAFELATHGLGISVYPEFFVKAKYPAYPEASALPVDFYPIDDKDTVGTFAIVNSMIRPLSPAAREFIKTAKEVLPAVMDGKLPPGGCLSDSTG